MLSRQQLQEAFDKVDTDKSGSIDVAELEVLAKDLNTEINMTDVESLFNEIDLNHDGKVSFNEFTAWWRLGRHSGLRKVMKATLKAQSKVALFDQTCCKHSTADQKRLIHANLIYGKPEENTVSSFGVTGDSSALIARVTAALPNLSFEGPTVVTIFKCSNAEEARKGMLAFIQTIKDLLVEMGAPQEELDGQMPGPQDFGVVGDELFMCKNLNNHPGMEMFEEISSIGTLVLQTLNVNGCLRFISGGDFTQLRTTNITEINCQWETHADLHLSADWRERFIALMTQMKGPYASIEAKIRMFDEFSFSMRLNTSNSEKSVEAQKRMLGMFNDASGLKYSPVGKTVDAFTNGDLDISSWNWNARKGELASMVKSQLGTEVEENFSIDSYPFVADFVNNWYTNVVCDVEVHLVNGPLAFNHGFKTAGLGDFVNEIMDLLK